MKKIEAQMLESILAELAISDGPLHLCGEEHNAVLVSEKDWSAIQEALYYLSIPGVIESIDKNQKISKKSNYNFGMN